VWATTGAGGGTTTGAAGDATGAATALEALALLFFAGVAELMLLLGTEDLLDISKRGMIYYLGKKRRQIFI
jgi:hypothetical protein